MCLLSLPRVIIKFWWPKVTFQDGIDYSVWSLQVDQDAIRLEECWLYFSEDDGSDSPLFCVCWLCAHSQSWLRVTPPSCLPEAFWHHFCFPSTCFLISSTSSGDLSRLLQGFLLHWLKHWKWRFQLSPGLWKWTRLSPPPSLFSLIFQTFCTQILQPRFTSLWMPLVHLTSEWFFNKIL